MANKMLRWTLLLPVALLLTLAGASLAHGYPGGGPGFVLLPRTDATPSCAGCHASTSEKYMREVPPDGLITAANEVVQQKHYKDVKAGEKAYKLLSAAEREKLLQQVELIDKNASVTIKAPQSAAPGRTIEVTVTARGGIGPGAGIMLVDNALRFQARPVQGNGWFIVGPPKVIGPDGKEQTFWVDGRFKDLPKNVNFVVAGGGADLEKKTFPTVTVTWTLEAPRKPGTYSVAAAFLYGTEEPNEHKEPGKYTLPPGGLTGPSGRVMFSEVVEIEVQ